MTELVRPFIVITGEFFIAPVLLLALAAFWRASMHERKLMLRRGTLVLILGVVLAKISGALYYDPRPFVVRHVSPLIPHAADNGLPSDHTILAFGAALLILPFSRRLGVAALILSAFVSWGRMAALLHSPLDIAAGILFALAANLVAALVFRSRTAA